MSLIAKHLAYAYDTSPVINDVDIEIKPGNINVVIGPNGAGKSSLLKLLSAELKADSGTILLNQQALNEWKRRDLARVRTIFHQNESLSFAFTVMEVVLFGRTPHKTGHAENREICLSALKVLDALQFKDRLYTELSGGEKQRVQLARCFAQIWGNKQARYLLLDEPVSALDIAHQKILMQQVKNFSEQNVGVVIALHDLNLAAQYADQILLMNEGRLVSKGTPQQVLTTANIESVYKTAVSVIPHPESKVPQILIS